MNIIQSAKVPDREGGFRPREYAHVVFRTRQPQALIDWYCKVLGMQVVMRHDLINFLTWDHSQDRLAIVNDPTAAPRPANTVGFHHVAYELGSLHALTGQYRHLKGMGITPARCMNHGVATSMYYQDPDGNEIELTVEAFESVEELNAWLATGAFDRNPVGVVCDPEELCRRLDAGEPESEVRKPVADHGARLAEVLARVAPDALTRPAQ